MKNNFKNTNEYEFINDSVIEDREFMAKVFFDKGLIVTADIFYKGQPINETFFKVYRTHFIDEEKINRIIDGVCRISLDCPKYIVGYDENITLTNNEIDRLISGLSDGNNGEWKYLLEQTNWAIEALELSNHQYDVNNYPMPDYNLLKQ